MRYAYVTGDPTVIGTGHHNLAVAYGRGDHFAPRVWAHYLASALIAWRTGHGSLGTEIEMLTMFAFAHGTPTQPTFDQACALVEETEGVRFRELCARLPQREDNELQLLTDKAVARGTEVFEVWRPLMTAVGLAAIGRPDMADELQAELARLEQDAEIVPLVLALRRVLAGERGSELLDGLGMLPYAIVSKVLDAISAQERAGS